jgi:ABC-type branched-subunit amino acid transport system ATPase component
VIDFLDLQPYRDKMIAGLPYGVRKVVELARALSTQPRLLLLDEPASGLSVEETQDMRWWIDDIRRQMGITVLMVEHDMGLVSKVCDRVLALDGGRKLAEGTAHRGSVRSQGDRGLSGHRRHFKNRQCKGRARVTALLEVRNLETYYGPIMAIRGVSLEVQKGEVVTVLGANGAGKTTLLKTISGIMDPEKGKILFEGEEIQGREPHQIVRRGIVHVPEGREVFPLLTVEENLALGAYTRSDRAEIARDRDLVFSYFPILAERRLQEAGTLSGGQQQMLAIGRG